MRQILYGMQILKYFLSGPKGIYISMYVDIYIFLYT